MFSFQILYDCQDCSVRSPSTTCVTPWHAVFLKSMFCFAIPTSFLHLPADPCGCFNIHLSGSLVPAWPAGSNTMTAVSVGLQRRRWQTLNALSFSEQLKLREDSSRKSHALEFSIGTQRFREWMK